MTKTAAMTNPVEWHGATAMCQELVTRLFFTRC